MSIVKYRESHYVTSSPRVPKAQWLEHPTGVTEVSPRGEEGDSQVEQTGMLVRNFEFNP